MNPFLATDGYKTGHHRMYPDGTGLVYSNFTPRSAKHAPAGINMVVSFGQQMVMKQIEEMFNEHFFFTDMRKGYNTSTPCANHEIANFLDSLRKKACNPIKDEYSMYLDTDYDVSHIEALWDLGYLPIEVKSLPEGTVVPMGVPVLTIKNTLPEFYWITNFLETLISNLLWKPMTSATIAHQYKKNLVGWAKQTDENAVGFVEFQGHDFSMRGLDSIDATIASGLGHATSFLGSDSLPVIHGARKYYGETGFVVGSVNATEHSVMSAGIGLHGEFQTYAELLHKFPTGILSIVSDTMDLWQVITDFLPKLKAQILARDGKVVIRPDSGNPVDILCGKEWVHHHNHKDGLGETRVKNPNDSERKGVIELLWDIFGGSINEQGYKVLNPKIGAIYGDSITLDRADEICERLEAKGFATTNVVLGIGSFTYQYNTRDTFGFAMKATYCEVNGKGIEIFKDPVTDDGTKKSAKGLLHVGDFRGSSSVSNYILSDQVDWASEEMGSLQVIYKDGEFQNLITLTEIREELNKQL